MDGELLIALCVLWFSTTVALIGFLCMWYLNGGEAFHPHSVEIEPTHRAFVVVSSKTTCKYDCAVKSISAFAAPRGSTSYQQFTALSVMIAVSGFLGTARWQAVGDANRIEAILSYIGFSSLLLVATFEVDVSPETFLKDKLLVTSWLIEKLGAHKEYPFNQPSTSKEFLDFVRKSPRIYDLFEEDRVVLNHADKSWYYNPVWGTLHMLGALIYISCVTASIILNDMAEEKVGWITGVHFLIFGFLGYLTGNYLPVIAPLRGYILTWNPFYSDPDFMENLKWSVIEYQETFHQSKCLRTDEFDERDSMLVSKEDHSERSRKRHQTPSPKSPMNSSKKTKKTKKLICHCCRCRMLGLLPMNGDDALNNFSLRWAKKYPQDYLILIGRFLVMSELITLLTPAVAMGIQWVTALCDGPPVLALIDLLTLSISCFLTGSCDGLVTSEGNRELLHCILKPSMHR